MARQPTKKSSRSTTTKRRTTSGRKKNKTSDKSILLIGLVIVLLCGVMFVGIYTLQSEKSSNVAKEVSKPEKKEVVVKKEKKKEDEVKKTTNDVKETKKETKKVVQEKDEDITAIIRLILYDYEISRTSVKEKTTKGEDGRLGHFYNIRTNSDTAKRAKNTIISVLKQKGYTVKGGDEKITAGNKKKFVDIVFVTPKVKEVADRKDEDKKDKKNINKEKQVSNIKEKEKKLPTPPAPANRVVKMAILLDDGGNSSELAERFAKSKYPMAIAILPHLEYSKEAAKISSAYGKSIFLHYPMQPKSYPDTDSGEGSALVSMPEILIEGVTKKNFEEFSGVHIDGFNNHMGSAITEDRAKMSQIFKYAKKYTDTFVDSRTTPNSVAYDECVKAGLRCGINKKFIDNDNDVNTIIKMIYEAAEIAKKDGEVLVIGHIRQKTLEALEIALPILESRKVAIVPIKTLVR